MLGSPHDTTRLTNSHRFVGERSGYQHRLRSERPPDRSSSPATGAVSRRRRSAQTRQLVAAASSRCACARRPTPTGEPLGSTDGVGRQNHRHCECGCVTGDGVLSRANARDRRAPRVIWRVQRPADGPRWASSCVRGFTQLELKRDRRTQRGDRLVQRQMGTTPRRIRRRAPYDHALERAPGEEFAHIFARWRQRDHGRSAGRPTDRNRPSSRAGATIRTARRDSSAVIPPNTILALSSLRWPNLLNTPPSGPVRILSRVPSRNQTSLSRPAAYLCSRLAISV